MRNERCRGKRRGLNDQVPAAHNERRRGQRPGATIKYLRRATSAAAGSGLGTTIKYLRCTTSGAAGNGRAKRSSTCDAQQAGPRASDWAPRPSNCAAPRASAWAPRSSTCVAPQASVWAPRLSTCNAQRAAPRAAASAPRSNTCAVPRKSATVKYLRRTTSAAAGNGPGTTTKYLVSQKTRARVTTGSRPTTQRLGTNSAQSPYNLAAFVVNLETHTGERPSVRVCVWGPSFLAVFKKNV
jgi:hypothetical protein